MIKPHIAGVHAESTLRLLGDDVPALHVPDLELLEVGCILWFVSYTAEP